MNFYCEFKSKTAGRNLNMKRASFWRKPLKRDVTISFTDSVQSNLLALPPLVQGKKSGQRAGQAGKGGCVFRVIIHMSNVHVNLLGCVPRFFAILATLVETVNVIVLAS